MEDLGEIEIPTGKELTDPLSEYSLQNKLGENSTLLRKANELADEINRGRTESEFADMFHKRKEKYHRVARRIRHKFWNMYNEVVDPECNRSKIIETMVYGGIVNQITYEKIMANDLLATYILTQPSNIRSIQESALYEGYSQLEEIMYLPVLKDDGSPNTMLINQKLKIINMLEDRMNGSVVQRSQSYIEQKSQFDKTHMPSDKEVAKIKEEIIALKKAQGKLEIEEAKFKDIDE